MGWGVGHGVGSGPGEEAEVSEDLLGGGGGGDDGEDGPAATAGAAPDVGVEGAALEGGPVEARRLGSGVGGGGLLGRLWPGLWERWR